MVERELKRITLQYFAVFQDQAGRDRETITTTAPTPLCLYEELQERYAFPLDHRAVRVAINDEFSRWDVPLRDRDTVVFLAPVSGG